jgi:lipopolysaccharide export system permease protein
VILKKYIAREVAYTTASVTLTILLITSGWRFSAYLNEAAQGTLSSDILLLIIAYKMPAFIELILPISFFLSLMLTYARMHVDNEMVVIESSGLGQIWLIGVTLTLALVVMIITALFSIWLKPIGENAMDSLMEDQRNMSEFDVLVPGRFQATKSGRRVTYAEALTKPTQMTNVFINEYERANRNPGEVTSITAAEGEFRVDSSGNHILILRDGYRITESPGSKAHQIITYHEFGQVLKHERAPHRNRRITAISTMDLLATPDPIHMAQLHWRISVVLMIPVMALIAIPLSRVNARQGRHNKLLPGMLICFLYVICLSGATTGIARGNLPLNLGLWWVHGFFLAITYLIYTPPRLAPFLWQRRA